MSLDLGLAPRAGEDSRNNLSRIDKKASQDTGSVRLVGSYRLFVALCGCLSMCMSFASQTSMSSAMVCMIDVDNDDSNNNNNSSSTPEHGNNSHISRYHVVSSSEYKPWRFSWDSETKGWVIASFFVGYYVIQIPSGVIVSKFGPKTSMVVGLMLTAIFHVLSVVAAVSSLPLLYVIRFLAGVFTGCLLPGTYALVANWTPLSETSMLYGIAGAGLEIGNSLSFFVSMIGCESDFQGGWPIVFYTLACLHFLLGVVIMVWVTNFPSNNRFIACREETYITNNNAFGDKQRNNHIPFGQILTSLPVWAFLVSEFGTEWMYYTISTQGPLFLRDIIELSPSKTNIVSSIPYLTVIPLVILTGSLSDKLVQRRLLSTGAVRKANDAYSKIFTATALFILGFLPRGPWLGAFILYLLVAVGMSGTYSGYMANPGDLSPSHAGFLAALGQAVTTWTSMVIPVLTGSLTGQKNRDGWLIIFSMAGGIQVICFIFFLVFGSGRLQPWAAVETVDERTSIVSRGNGQNKEKNYF